MTLIHLFLRLNSLKNTLTHLILIIEHLEDVIPNRSVLLYVLFKILGAVLNRNIVLCCIEHSSSNNDIFRFFCLSNRLNRIRKQDTIGILFEQPIKIIFNFNLSASFEQTQVIQDLLRDVGYYEQS